MFDRITPTYRPLGWPIGYQRWHTLLFLHWPVPVAALRARVPASLTLDLFEGVAYAGIVAFAIEQVRAPGMPAWLGLDFLETNARTYVHLDGRDPGVYFFSLDAASPLAVAGARVGFGLPYYPARMGLQRRGRAVRYAMRRHLPNRPRFAVQYTIGASLGPAAPGTLEHFLVERYLLHVERRGALWTTQVHHRPYPLHRAQVHAVHDELLRAAGLPAPDGPPLAHFATRVDVDVFAPRRRDAAQARSRSLTG